jgi:hypothetical protein
MASQAKYYANLRTGKSIYLCAGHVTKVAKKLDNLGHLAPKRGVRSIGSLSTYTPKQCVECIQEERHDQC